MSQRIGILVDRRVLRRALGGRPTIERISLYPSVAAELGIDIVVFAIEDVHARRRTLKGYVPTRQGWRTYRGPIPLVVHKRVLFRENAPLIKLRSLHRRGHVFINPLQIQNKRRMNEVLGRARSVAPHLPPTGPYSWRRLSRMLDAGESAVLKPKVGSLGQGILRVLALDAGRVELCRKRRRELGRAALRRRLKVLVSPKRYLLQRYIPLALYQNRPFDLRVPVQRDGQGRWVVPGFVAKVAGAHPFLTNMAQGGRALPGTPVIEAAFGKEASAVEQRVRRLAHNVARAVSKRHPYAADLGLDIGIDQDGMPWLLEVNTRDQRYTFFNAGMHETFRELYRNPLAFCSFVAGALAKGESWRKKSGVTSGEGKDLPAE